MTERVGQCQICEGWFRIEKDRRLEPHLSVKAARYDVQIRCRGVNPRPPKPEDYTEGWDHHPAEISAGAWEQNRRRH